MTINWIKPKITTAGQQLAENSYYDEEAANRAVDFFRLLQLVEGKGAGKTWELLPWMEYEIIRPLFGYKRADGTRMYRTVWVEVGRKNAKTTLAAGIALYSLTADGEAAPQVIIGARDRQQAKLCFELARKMVASSNSLRHCRAVRSYIENPRNNGVLRTVSADASGQHGLNCHTVIIDEVHAHRTRDLWEVLATSVGAREQPIVMGITTAGVYNPHSIAWEMHTYAERVASGDVLDSSFLGVIYAADPSDDYTVEETWAKANPSIGVTIMPAYLQEEVTRAQVSPARQTTFKQLHLNIWTTEVSQWIDPKAWDECGDVLDTYTVGDSVYAGLDLSSTTDISALSVLYVNSDKETYNVVPYFWMPEADILERERRDRLPYRQWVADGHIQLTSGNVIDYGYIKKKILELADTYSGFTLAYDPWNATSLVTDLMAEGLQCIPTRQGFATLSAPTKELERLILGKRIRHASNPVLKAHVDAALVQTDAAGNIKPDKARSTARIDGLIALVMALNSTMLSTNSGRSVYESRGVQYI